jgi:excisionase family DNA binding protein
MDLRTVAHELGVHYMTVYGWVRSGELPAVQRGRRYDVTPEELERFQEARRRPAAPQRRHVTRWDRQVAPLVGSLRDGDETGARHVVERLANEGVAAVAICEHLLAPALRRVGEEWAKGRLNVAEEHRAAAICARLLAPLAPPRRGRPRGRVVVLTGPGDRHALPAVMATVALREARWHVDHVDVDVPTADLTDLLATIRPDVVVISLTYPPAARATRQLARAIEATGPRALVGAPGASLAELVRLVADDHAAPSAASVGGTVSG